MRQIEKKQALGVLMVALVLLGSWAGPGDVSAATVTIDATAKTGKTNPLLLGNNVQWVDSADNLYDPNAKTFNSAMMNILVLLKVPLLRFPGGSLATTYHWQDAVGAVSLRKPGLRADMIDSQPSYFGTEEFLSLCKQLNSKAIMTVNTLTGTSDEAAKWVYYCNKTKAAKIKYWEIGNEPYLEEPSQYNNYTKGYPETFAKKFIEFSKKMKIKDRSIMVGLPLDGGHPPSPYYPDWNAKVVSICGTYADFVSVHNTYYPAILNAEDFQDPGSFQALMAASGVVKDNINKLDAFLKSSLPSKKLPIAVTEHNSFFALPPLDSAKYTASLTAGLYGASLLMDWYRDPRILLANFWSLTGNWYFGVLQGSSAPRPQAYTVYLFANYVGTDLLASQITDNPVVNSPASGFVPVRQGTGALDVLATSSGKKVFVLVLNKSVDQDVPLSIFIKNFTPSSVVPSGLLFTGTSYKADNETSAGTFLQAFEVKSFSDLSNLVVPRHSLAGILVEAA